MVEVKNVVSVEVYVENDGSVKVKTEVTPVIESPEGFIRTQCADGSIAEHQIIDDDPRIDGNVMVAPIIFRRTERFNGHWSALGE